MGIVTDLPMYVFRVATGRQLAPWEMTLVRTGETWPGIVQYGTRDGLPHIEKFKVGEDGKVEVVETLDYNAEGKLFRRVYLGIEYNYSPPGRVFGSRVQQP